MSRGLNDPKLWAYRRTERGAVALLHGKENASIEDGEVSIHWSLDNSVPLFVIAELIKLLPDDCDQGERR